MKYTVKEVRQYARITDGMVSLPKLTDMLTELAERIEADEGAVPAYWAAIGEKEPDGSGGEIVLAYPADDGNDGEAARTECNQCINDAMLNERVRLRLVPLFTHPPAQAAQSVDIEAIREVIESHINEAKRLRHDPETQDYLYEQADKLEAAIRGGA